MRELARWPAWLRDDDVAALLDAGLLQWNGEAAALRDAGIAENDIAALQALREARLFAIASRTRHDLRAQRLAAREAERTRRREEAASKHHRALPDAAASALARALAKAKRP